MFKGSKMLFLFKIICINFFNLISILNRNAKIIINHVLSQCFSINKYNFSIHLRCIRYCFFGKI